MNERGRWVLAVVVIVGIAAGLRLWMPGPTIRTVDELNWSVRSKAFHEAVVGGDLEAAVAAPPGTPATRPGVTTMWVGALAIELEDRGVPFFDDTDGLRNAHRLMAIACALLLWPFLVAAGSLVGRRAALVAGGLLAVEPLLVGHSALLHTDAIMSMGIGVAVVALVAAYQAARAEHRVRDTAPASAIADADVVGATVPWWRRPSNGLGALAGLGAAVALLTKVTAVVPLTGAVVVAAAVAVARERRTGRRWPPALRRSASVLVVPGVVAASIVLAAWPALWVDPLTNIEAVAKSTELAREGSSRLFLGTVVEGGDWRYYPVELVFRSSPWLLVGVVGALAWKAWGLATGRPRVVTRGATAVLVGSGLLYAIVIVTNDKQYGRYLLPLLPLAAVGLGVVADQLVGRAAAGVPVLQRSPWITSLVGWAALALVAAWTLSLAPYQISHVSPLAGGQRAAEGNIPLGWGEGREVVIRAFGERLAGGPCPAWAGEGPWMGICPKTRQGWEFLDGTDPSPELVLRYVAPRQLGEAPDGLAEHLDRHGVLLEHVTIDGVRYAELWELPQAG